MSGNSQLVGVGASWDSFDGVAPGSLTTEENEILANIRGFHTASEVDGATLRST